MPRIFAYVVGIGAYPDPGARLHGPVNDVSNIVEFLDAFTMVSSNTQLCVHQLLDTEATRAAIIDGFSFLADAGPDDFALFFYSGHGSQMKVAEDFVNDQDKLQESFVCWDSREEGHFDLMDKEVAYLLHKNTHQARPHGVAIIDSCHSGGVMRDLHAVARMQPAPDQVRTIETYFEHQSYMRDEDGKYMVPHSDILLLAACEPNERSKEGSLESPGGEKVQGIFTHALLRILRDCGNHLSYANLMNKAAILVDKYSTNQTPYLTSFGTEKRLANRYFLDDALSFSPTRLLVKKDRFDDYHLEAGQIHGISPGDQLLLDDGSPLKITELGPHRAQVSGVPGNALSYEVKRIPDRAGHLSVGWYEEHDADARSILEEQLAQNKGILVRVLPGRDGAHYMLRAEEDHYFITKKADPEQEAPPVFRRILGFTPDSALVFLNHLNAIARYRRVLDLANTNSAISDDDIRIDFYRVTDPCNYTNKAPKERIRDPLVGIDLVYEQKDGKWCMPAFQLCVRNRSHFDYWIAGLYMGPDKDPESGTTTLFAIDDGLMPEQQLKKGSELWMQAGRQKTLPFEILDDQWNGKDTTVEAHLKIVVSGQRPGIGVFNQPGVPIERAPVQKKSGRGPEDEPSSDWRTFEIRLHVHRPAAAHVQPLS